jgi:hypothetical protein
MRIQVTSGAGLAGLAALLTGGCLSSGGGAKPAVAAPLVADYYVAASGNAHWSGTLAEPNPAGTDGPFATLEQARDEIRKRKAAGGMPAQGITVAVRAGVYSLTRTFELGAQDSGTAEAPVVYRAYPGETVHLSGGVDLPAAAFTAVTDAAVLPRLAAAVRGKVVQADLRALGIVALGQLPARYFSAPALPELFYDDQPMALARWPDQGWTTIAKIVSPGASGESSPGSTDGGVFEYTGERPRGWNVDTGVWLLGYWCFDWYPEAIRVKSIDPATRQIALAVPALYTVKQGNPSPRRYCALNLLEELDRPGEYYIDRDAGRLYFLPPGPLAGKRVVLSTLGAPLVALRETANVVIRGFVIEAGLSHGIEVSGGSGNRIQACEVRNVRAQGVNVSGGTTHRVEACDIHDTGTGGITLAGGDRKTLTPAGHEALNNHIWRFSRHQLTYASAISLNGVGNRAAHNLLHDAPHMAVGIGGNDHVFEYNVVHHVCTETDDSGALYTGRNPSCRGNIVRYNFWHNIGSPMGHGNAAVYFDDGDGGFTVLGNVFFRCGDPGRGSFGTVFSHGGHDNLSENNIFVECKRAMGSAPWNDKRWKEAIDGGVGCFWKERLLQEVDITKPPYTTRYPQLVGFMDPQPGQPRLNRAVRNLLVMCAEVSGGNWQLQPAENLVTDRDPGFVNAAKGNFQLRPDAEVFTRLPGFQPVPFAKMGLYADALRPTLPAAEWPYEPPKPLPPLAQNPAVGPSKQKAGTAPVFPVAKVAGPLAIDGTIDPKEWGTANPASALLLARDVGGGTVIAARQSRAWLAYDQDSLYVAIESLISPETKLDGNEWGANDAVEISLQVLRKDGKVAPVTVIRGFGNGFVQLGTTTSTAETKAMDPGGTQFRAARPEPGRWTAECRIPFRLLDMDPAAGARLACNLTVRKTHEDLWLMWEGTSGQSYDVSQAGIIELSK